MSPKPEAWLLTSRLAEEVIVPGQGTGSKGLWLPLPQMPCVTNVMPDAGTVWRSGATGQLAEALGVKRWKEQFDSQALSLPPPPPQCFSEPQFPHLSTGGAACMHLMGTGRSDAVVRGECSVSAALGSYSGWAVFLCVISCGCPQL